MNVDARRLADLDASQILFHDVRHHADAADIHDVGNGLVRRHERAGVDHPSRDEPVDRGADQRVGQRDAELLEPGLCLYELRPGQVELGVVGLIARLRILERLLRQQLAVEQVAGSLDVGFRELEVRLALPDRRTGDLECRLGLLHLLTNLTILDSGDLLATRDAVAKPYKHFLEATGGLRHPLPRSSRR